MIEPQARRLQACVDDLATVLALRGSWGGGQPELILSTLIDALVHMVPLDLAYARARGADDEPLTEVIRLADRRAPGAARAASAGTPHRRLYRPRSSRS